ncbi:MAG: DNA internalization-related competence protein ComEC/Rec2 [Lachnospiraceae bacterium]|nr:DNA internalization-related competence protein ComEC/Rec2 [Lachnospiraceae bacterium]
MKRPMLYWVSLFILGEVSDRILPIGILGIAAVGMGLVICFLPAVYCKKNRWLLLFGILFYVWGAAGMDFTGHKLAICQTMTGEEVGFEGIVIDREALDTGGRYRIRTRRLGDQELRVSIRIVPDTTQELVPGSRIRGTGVGRMFRQATNPGGYDEQREQYGKGVFLQLQDVVITQSEIPHLPFRRLLYRIREEWSGVYDELLGERNASLAKAMVLGDKASLDPDLKQLYQRNGIAHLIAISGLHIAMIGGLFYQLIRRSLGSYPLAAGVGTVFILSYGVMTGLSGSTLRAILMLLISIGADVSGRKYDMLTAIAAALLCMLLENPYQIMQAGFLLSYGAVLGIAFVNPVWRCCLSGIPKRLEGVFVSLSVQMMLLPVMLYFFYEIPVYGIVLNILVVPLMELLLSVLLICGGIGWIAPQAVLPFARIAQMIFGIYEGLCRFGEHLPGHTMCTGRPAAWWIALYYGVLFLFVIAGYRSRKRVCLWSSVLLFGLLTVFALPGPFRICVFDVGQGDGIFLQTPHRINILMDGGSSSRQKVGTYVLKSGIRYYGGDTLDYIFISHCDSDHYSGVLELLEQEDVEIRNVVLPAIANPDEIYRELEQKAVKRGCHVYHIKKGDSLKADGVQFTCLSPEQKVYADKNQGSMVMLVTYQSFDLLLTGDADQTVETEIAGSVPRSLEVLKVAHHGSKTASSEQFLDKTRPAVACVSVGAGNRYGHPAPEVLRRLEQYCGRVCQTKDSGAIMIETDGTRYQVSTFLGR